MLATLSGSSSSSSSREQWRGSGSGSSYCCCPASLCRSFLSIRRPGANLVSARSSRSPRQLHQLEIQICQIPQPSVLALASCFRPRRLHPPTLLWRSVRSRRPALPKEWRDCSMYVCMYIHIYTCKIYVEISFVLACFFIADK